MNEKEKDELNRWCHTVLLGKCHQITTSLDWSAFNDEGICSECGIAIEKHDKMPDYCSSLDLASIVEAKAIERVGEDAYVRAVKREFVTSKTQDWYDRLPNLTALFLTASAETRCKAARAAVEGEA